MPWRGDPRTGTGAWRKVRAQVLKRDHYTCQRCGAQATEVDHVMPHGSGGSDHPSNLVAICVRCHRTKSAHEGAVARWQRYPRTRAEPKHPGLL